MDTRGDRALADGEAATIEFGEGPDRTLRITVLPDERIRFGYAGPDDEAASRDLVDRCASAIGCDVVLV